MSALPPVFNRVRSARFAALIGNGLLQATAMAGIGMTLQRQFDEAAAGALAGPGLAGAMATMTVLAIAIGWLKWRERRDAEALGQDYVHATRLCVFDHVSTLSVGAMERMRKGTILLRFVNDLSALRQWISLGLARASVSGVVLLGAAGVLLYMNLRIGAVVLVLLVLGCLGCLLLGRLLDSRIREARRRRGHLAANITEKLEQMVLVQAFAQRKTERRRVRRQSMGLRDAMVGRASAIGALRAAVHVLAGMLLVGALAAGAGAATAGEVVAAIGIVMLLTPSLFDFGRVYEYWKSAAIAREKLVEILERGPVISPSADTRPLRRVRGKLSFEQVSVTGVLNGFTATARRGEVVGICGPNGSGKSTLLRLALRLLEPDSGRVLLDGRDLRNIRAGELRRTVSLAAAEMSLLRGTIASNISYGSAKSTAEDVERAAVLCEMDLENSASAFHGARAVTEGGTNLSAGERMRVVLARALVSNPSVLLLDEPEEHLDACGVQVLTRIIERFDGTIVMATHDDRLLKLTNRLWELTHEPDDDRNNGCTRIDRNGRAA